VIEPHFDFTYIENDPWEQAVWLCMSAMPRRAAGSSVEVRKFWVKEKYRRLGHGTRALAFAIHKLFTAKATCVTVSTASQSGTRLDCLHITDSCCFLFR
jgi:GNAT superfamily N-acetyltransferase